jgi:hypothetical protein
MNREDNYFLKELYNGSDNLDFKTDFISYLKTVLVSNSFVAMSDHQLFLDGGKQAIIEIIKELELV